ncbi:hypothetical protein GH714_028844 [Hevea brasiliensis]|uniref:Reverse transcriptase zinc-binding domain-containing protein n=1 Tax=Hevea brasiliensis TaxID=3981 RepID=A0A6A6LUR0_HEVBR|nr:hypothetical protein GH714_028844 [Hevea brasiliensis]
MPDLPLLANLVGNGVVVPNMDAPINSFVNFVGEWDWNALHLVLDYSILDRIAVIPPPRYNAGCDRIVWAPSKDDKIHILQDCPVARNVWMGLGASSKLSSF